MFRFSKIFFVGLALTGNQLLVPVAAKPAPTVPEELSLLVDLAKAFESFCLGANCNDAATVRRHLEDDESVATRALEGSLMALVEKHNSENAEQTIQPPAHRMLQNLGDLAQCIVPILACDLYLDNLYMPQVEEYRFNDVVLDQTCEKLTGLEAIEFTDKTGSTKPEEFRFQDFGPPQLQGVFSLNYEPCDWSSLVSFAESSATAPGGISTGVVGNVGLEGFVQELLTGDFITDLELDGGAVVGPVRAPSEYVYAMRVLGDANWAFGDSLIAPGFVAALDLVYKFVLLEGGVNDPKKFQIIPDIKIPFTCIRLEIKNCLENLVRFYMTLVDPEVDTIDGTCEASGDAAAALGKSVIWRRDSVIAGIPSCYYIIQVVDGDGKKLVPAWDNFVSRQQECQGTPCPINQFSSIQGESDGGFCQCAYTGDLPYGLDNIAKPFFGDSKGSGKGDLKRGRRTLAKEDNPRSTYTRSENSRRTARRGSVARHARELQTCGKYTSAPTEAPTNDDGCDKPQFQCGTYKGKPKYAYCYQQTYKGVVTKYNKCDVIATDFGPLDFEGGDPKKPVLNCGCCTGGSIKGACSVL